MYTILFHVMIRKETIVKRTRYIDFPNHRD